jgi:tRNA U34 5-methylaminomethyl-2-thiouridine-forming methyltransferase MnmC
MKNFLIKTNDKSHTIFSQQFNELYHSVHGAIQESEHIFIKSGLNSYDHSQHLHILEIGFGTGLNALLTLIESHKLSLNINYTCIEAYPVSLSTVTQLNYIDMLNATLYFDSFQIMHQASNNTPIQIGNNFTFKKIIGKIENYELNNHFDIIYFDPFGPDTQPELWTETIFKKLFAITIENGFLITYCSKGVVKRNLIKSGFIIQNLPGPPGKREITKAIKP